MVSSKRIHIGHVLVIAMAAGACGPASTRDGRGPSTAASDDPLDAAPPRQPTRAVPEPPDAGPATAPAPPGTAETLPPPAAPRDGAVPVVAAADARPPGDGLDLSIKGTSVTFRTKILPWLIRRCGACHGDVFKDPRGPQAGVTNEDELYALRWLRGKTDCAKATIRERVLPATFRDDRVTAARSYLWKKLTNAPDICGSPMPKPPEGKPWMRIPGDQAGGELFIISDWIAHGGA